MHTPGPIEKWHQIVATRNFAGIDQLLADDIAFHSPVVHTPKLGKSRTLPYLHAAVFVFLNDSFHYVREVIGEYDAVLEFELDLDGTNVNGVDMIKWNDDGLIVEFKVMLRPLQAVNLIHQKMGEILAPAFIAE